MSTNDLDRILQRVWIFLWAAVFIGSAFSQGDLCSLMMGPGEKLLNVAEMRRAGIPEGAAFVHE